MISHVWRIYQNPADHPGKFVARHRREGHDGMKVIREGDSGKFEVADTLQELRAILKEEHRVFGLWPTTAEKSEGVIEIWM